MFCHLMISSIQCGRIPVAFRMIHCRRTVIRNKHRCNAAEEFKHLDMRFDPVVCPLVQVCLYKGILAVSKDSYKYPCLRDLTGVWIDELCRITGPIYFNLLPRFPWDVHGCPAFFFILLNVVAELGIHERFFAIHTAFLTVFYP